MSIGIKAKADILSFFTSLGVVRGVEYLLDHGLAEVNAQDSNGVTALHCAVMNDKVGCLNVLVGKGAQQNLTNKQGVLPLHCAAMEGRETCLKVLLNSRR